MTFDEFQQFVDAVFGEIPFRYSNYRARYELLEITYGAVSKWQITDDVSGSYATGESLEEAYNRFSMTLPYVILSPTEWVIDYHTVVRGNPGYCYKQEFKDLLSC